MTRKSTNKQQKRAVARAQIRKSVMNKPKQLGNAPVAIGRMINRPNFVQRERRFRRTERITSVSGSTEFSTTKIPINPGLGTFPQLMKEAEIFDQYRFHMLKFCYQQSSSTSAKGLVYLTPDYAPRDSAPEDLNQAGNNKDVARTVPWEPVECRLDPSAMFPLGHRKYIRQSLVAGDLNLYDAGNLFISTSGQADTSEIGEVWAEYDVEFFCEQSSPSDYLQPSQVTYMLKEQAQSFATTVEETIDIDPDSDQAFDPLGWGDSSGVGVFTPPAGVYEIRWIGQFNDSSAEAIQCTLKAYKNNAAVGPAVVFQKPTVGGSLATAYQIVLGFNGEDTFELRATLVGAAGTLTLVANTGTLVIRVA